MTSRKIAWIMLCIGAAIMGGTYFLYIQSEPAAQAQTGVEAEQTQTPDAQPDSAAGNQDPPEEPAGRTPDNGQGELAAPAWAGTDLSETRSEKYYIGSANPGSGYMFQIEAVGRGAAIYTLKLAQYQATIEDKQLAAENPDTYDSLWQDKGDDYQGPYSLLNPVNFDNQSALPFATRGIYWTIGQSEKPEPLWAPRTGGQGWIAKDLIEDEDSQSLPFEYKIQRNGREFLTVTKTYTVRKGDYSFTLELKVQNHSTQTVNVCLDQLGPTGVPKEDYDKDVRQIVYAQLSPDGEVQPTLVAAPGNGVYEDVPLNDRKYVSGQGKDPIWVGVMNKYFASLVYLESGSDATLANLGDDPEFYYGALKESQTSQALFAGLMIGSKDLSDETTIEQGVSLAKSMKLDRPEQVARIRPSLVIKPNGVQTVSMNVFCGPKKRDIFTDEENHPLYAQLNYLSTIDVSSCCPVSVDFLAIGMMWLLQTFSVVALGNWGIAIILLVLLVRLVLHPLSKKSQTSMAKMQKLGPQVKKVQEKYKDDKATMQKEVMKIYREAGASPFLGCLPMFLQIPIWIALWTAVRVSVELRHAAFLPVWLTDLSTPDQLIEFGQALPIIGSSFNLLPILLGVAMYLQMKLSPQMAGGAGGATTPEQQAQQKMMQFLMPGMMLMFFYNAPAGLTLYIMASTFVGVMESKIIRKHIREKEAAEAAAETVVQGPGKGARSSRPKKPKGPFWHKNG